MKTTIEILLPSSSASFQKSSFYSFAGFHNPLNLAPSSICTMLLRFISTTVFIIASLLQLPIIATAETPITYRLEQTTEGMAIVFPQPMAVDRILVSATHPGVWGLGRAAQIAIARTASHSAVAGWKPDAPSDLLIFSLADPCTERIELIALTTIDAPIASPSFELRIEGTVTRRRLLENRLAALTIEVSQRQTRQGCFCCHQVLPLALASHLARIRGIPRPKDRLTAWILSLASSQHQDGSFSFPDAPRFGIVTPTLVAAAVMGWLHELHPTLETSLLKAISFLVSHQQPDGSLIPDFNFPPLLAGRPAMGWLFVHSLREMSNVLEMRGLSPIAQFTWAQQRAESWLAEPTADDPNRAFFAWLAGAVKVEPNELASYQQELDFTREPDMSALLALIITQNSDLQNTLFSNINHAHPQPNEYFDKNQFRLSAWNLVRDLALEP